MSPRAATVVALVLCTACGTLSGLSEPVGTADPGAAANITLVSSGGLAGVVDTMAIDSVAATLSHFRCLTIRGAPESCPAGAQRLTISLGRAATDSIFRATQEAAFRALAPEYDMSGTFVDGLAYDLRITMSSRTRRIRWSDVPNLPAALTTFHERIRRRVQP